MTISSEPTRANVQSAADAPLPQQLQNRDTERLKKYRDHLDFYNGLQDDPRHRRRRLNRKVYNYVQTVVDKTASYVLTGFLVSIVPANRAAEPAARAAEHALAEIAENNALPLLDYVTEIDCSVLGDAAFKLGWSAAEQRVVITSPDVSGIFTWPDPADPLTLRRVAQRYQLPRADAAALWGFTTREDPATIIEEWTDDLLNVWEGTGTAPAFSQPNPYGFVPFLVYPNIARPKTNWGRSDIEQMIEPARELNDEATRLSNIMNLTGFPITVLENVTSSGDLAAEAGAIWELDKDQKAYVLDLLKGGVATQHLAYWERLLATFNDVSETPRSAFGTVERELSGVALEIDLLPLLQKVARKRTIRSIVYAARAGMALRILDLFTGTNHAAAGRLVVSWAPPTPRDRARDVETEYALVRAHLSSIQSSIARLGDDDPAQEITLMRRELDIWPGTRPADTPQVDNRH